MTEGTLRKDKKGGCRMATIKDISERAGVSMATVSRVLNKDDSLAVSDGVRKLIFEIAMNWGMYQGR